MQLIYKRKTLQAVSKNAFNMQLILCNYIAQDQVNYR